MRKTALPDDSSGQLTQSAWRNAWPPARGCFSCHRCSHTDPPGWHTPWQSQFCPCSQILKYRRAELLWIQRFKPFAILELCERRQLSVQPITAIQQANVHWSGETLSDGHLIRREGCWKTRGSAHYQRRRITAGSCHLRNSASDLSTKTCVTKLGISNRETPSPNPRYHVCM